jgi:hypothetical protein
VFLAGGGAEVDVNMPSSQGAPPDEWRVNLLKDGGRRVMYGGNAYEDDVEPAAAGEPGQQATAPAAAPPRRLV